MQPTLDDIADVIDTFTSDDLDKLTTLIEETRHKKSKEERKARRKEILQMIREHPLFTHDDRDSVDIVEDIRSSMFNPNKDNE